MKTLSLLISAAVLALASSSCCSMFGVSSQSAGYSKETKRVKTCHYDVVTKQVRQDDGSKDGMIVTIEEKVPRYKTVTHKRRVSCGPAVRFFCPTRGCGGTTSESFAKRTTSSVSTGGPFIGLAPTMKPLAP